MDQQRQLIAGQALLSKAGSKLLLLDVMRTCDSMLRRRSITYVFRKRQCSVSNRRQASSSHKHLTTIRDKQSLAIRRKQTPGTAQASRQPKSLNQKPLCGCPKQLSIHLLFISMDTRQYEAACTGAARARGTGFWQSDNTFQRFVQERR